MVASVLIKDVSDSWSENPDRIFYNGEKSINISVSNTNSEDLLSTAEKINEYICYNKELLNIVCVINKYCLILQSNHLKT